MLLPIAFLLFSQAPAASPDWNGYEKREFTVDGHTGYVVVPKMAAPGKPWLWRARFPEYHPDAAIALLAKGFHVAYLDLPNIFGNPAAVASWDRFYEYVTRTFGLSPRLSLDAVSRGALFAYNWAARHPERIDAIFCDSPVCDMKSWPGGKGKGLGSAPDWKQALESWGFTEERMLDFRGNPIDELEPLARAHVPLFHVVSPHDRIVPPGENTDVLAARYRALGGSVAVHLNTRGPETLNGHHFPLDDPEMAAGFIMRHTPGMENRAGTRREYFQLRDGLRNSLVRFSAGGNARVVFLGGSITAMKGWRDLVCRYLEKQFPQTKFDFVNAGIPSTGSTPGAFRLVRDVFGRGPVDLLFEEAAVNDDTNGFGPREQLRGMEGILRHAREINPNLDMVLLHFADPGKVAGYREGKTPEVIAVHERVAERYGVPSIDLAREVADRIAAGEFTWEKDFVNLHPSPFGHTVYFRSIQRLFEAAWTELQPGEALRSHAMPAPLDPKSYFGGHQVDVREVRPGDGWRVDPDWKPADQAHTRPGFVDVPMLAAETPGASCTFRFEGTAVGIFVAAGPDAGVVEYSIDGGVFRSQNLYTKWSKTLHIPWAYVFDADLPPGSHELVMRVAGGAVRIAHLLVN